MEEWETEVFGKRIRYMLRRSRRAKRVRITVRENARVVVTLPWGVPARVAQEFVKKKATWLLEKIAQAQESSRRNPPPSPEVERREYLEHREAARALITERVEHFNSFYGFNYGAIRIKNQKTRWGSCSSKGNLNFSYRLLFLPANLRDYVVVHELCHLKELNHTSRFWRLVAKVLPDYKRLRQELRTYSLWL